MDGAPKSERGAAATRKGRGVHRNRSDDDPQRQFVGAPGLEQPAYVAEFDVLALVAGRGQHQGLRRVESEIHKRLRPLLLAGCRFVNTMHGNHLPSRTPAPAQIRAAQADG